MSARINNFLSMFHSKHGEHKTDATRQNESVIDPAQEQSYYMHIQRKANCRHTKHKSYNLSYSMTLGAQNE